MNEIINPADAMINVTSEAEKVVDIIVNKILETRPQKQVKNIPYTKCKAYTADKPLGRLYINLKERYPNVSVGDVVYSDFNLYSENEKDIIVTLSSDSILFQDGNQLYDGRGSEEETKISAKLKAGNNIFTVRCECKSDKFGFHIMLSTTEYSFMWARDLLGNFRNTIPIDEYMECSNLCRQYKKPLW